MKMKKRTACALSMVAAAGMMLGSTAMASDITGHWAEANLQTFIDEGYLSGYGNDVYKPDSSITRAEMATIVDKMKCCKSKGRYQAVNLENANTIEFRIFKGTLNINTFLAAIQFVVTISSFAKQIKLSDIPFTSWRDIFMHSDFPELNNYLKIRELI